MGRKTKSRTLSWGELRFSVIADLLARPPEMGELRAELERIAGRCYRHPTNGSWIKFGFSTVERWYYRALESNDPVEALGRKQRSDAGECKAMSPELLFELEKQYRRYPQWTYRLHADNLAALVEEKPELGGKCSETTVRRRMQEKGWRKKKMPKNKTAGQARALERLEQREVRSFEASHAHALWHLDFHTAKRRIVDGSGEWYNPKALCVLDDHSRLACHIQWFVHEDSKALIHGLTQAMCKRGMPRSLMTDNGAAMLAHETRNGLRRLGIQHERTLPYSAYQNGKQESFWGQLEGRLMAMLSRTQSLDLNALNLASQAWVELEYNRRHHDEINTTPTRRLLDARDLSRPAPCTETMRLAFCDQVSRVQRRSDGTIQVQGIRFEIPNRFRHMVRLSVRFQSWDLSAGYLVDPRTGTKLATIFPLDKTKNACGNRRQLMPTDESTPDAPQAETEQYPPLLRKLIAEYAAHGLPPGFIPGDEEGEERGDQKEERHEQ